MSSGKVDKIETESTKKESKVEDLIDPQEVNKLNTDIERDNILRQKYISHGPTIISQNKSLFLHS